MSIFNTVKRKLTRPAVPNREGRPAFAQTAEMKLVSLLLTNFLQDQFYRSKQSSYDEIVRAMGEVNPQFAAKAATFARNEYGMRTVSHVVAANLAPTLSGTAYGKHFYNKIVRRPDDMLEIAALLRSLGVKHLPNATRKGFAKAFDRFDGYQLAKYRKENASISLVDLVNVVHPVPTRKNATALQQLVNGTLRNTNTWEAKLSAAGQNKKVDKATVKAEAWKELLVSGKIGYFALVRNLRNILQDAPSLTQRAVDILTDDRRIRTALVLPFRLFTAYRELEGSGVTAQRELRLLLEGLDVAIQRSFANMPDLGRALIVVDNSGSMGSPAAGSPKVTCAEVGALFGLAAAARSNADLMEFGTTARYLKYSLKDSPLKFASTFQARNRVGHGTDFSAIFRAIGSRRYERILIFSDMQSGLHRSGGDAALRKYRAQSGADPNVFCFDLRGYGTNYFPTDGGKVFQLAGFSEKAFDLLRQLETDPQALVRRIEAIEL